MTFISDFSTIYDLLDRIKSEKIRCIWELLANIDRRRVFKNKISLNLENMEAARKSVRETSEIITKIKSSGTINKKISRALTDMQNHFNIFLTMLDKYNDSASSADNTFLESIFDDLRENTKKNYDILKKESFYRG